MAINIKPLVLNKDNEQFKREWQAAVQESEAKLMQTKKSPQPSNHPDPDQHPTGQQRDLQKTKDHHGQEQCKRTIGKSAKTS